MLSRSFLVPALLIATLAGCDSATQEAQEPLHSTYGGQPSAFAGPGVLIVVLWADWAPTWQLLRPEVEAYQGSRPESTEFRYVDVDSEREMAKELGAVIIPSVVLVLPGGRVGKVFPNVVSSEELADAVRALPAS